MERAGVIGFLTDATRLDRHRTIHSGRLGVAYTPHAKNLWITKIYAGWLGKLRCRRQQNEGQQGWKVESSKTQGRHRMSRRLNAVTL